MALTYQGVQYEFFTISSALDTGVCLHEFNNKLVQGLPCNAFADWWLVTTSSVSNVGTSIKQNVTRDSMAVADSTFGSIVGATSGYFSWDFKTSPTNPSAKRIIPHADSEDTNLCVTLVSNGLLPSEDSELSSNGVNLILYTCIGGIDSDLPFSGVGTNQDWFFNDTGITPTPDYINGD